MSKPKILVIGATGRTGSAVSQQLLQRGWPVRAVIHRQDARSERLARAGAELVAADLFDADQLLAAMQGTARAYYCPPFHPHMVQSALAFWLAAREARLEAVVGLSQWLASAGHPSLLTRQHWLTDRLFGSLPGAALTIVNPGFFAEYPYLQLMPYAAHLGLFPMPGHGDSRNAPPSNEDIARVCVAALIDPARHAGKTYRPTGPALLSLREMAAVLGKVLGHRVRHQNLPMWMFYRAAHLDGVNRFELASVGHYVREQSQGTFELGAPTDDVLRVTGQAPESFETIARRYAQRPESRRSVVNRLRTLAKFMAVPLQPGFNPERFAQVQFHPQPMQPRLAQDDPRWLASHGLAALATREDSAPGPVHAAFSR